MLFSRRIRLHRAFRHQCGRRGDGISRSRSLTPACGSSAAGCAPGIGSRSRKKGRALSGAGPLS